MSYRSRPEFDQPDAESIQRTRRTVSWLIPLVIIQEGITIFRTDAGAFSHLMGVLAWGAVSLSMLWMVLGLPLRWVSQRDQAILNDEWNQSISGDASRWGIGALLLIGCGTMIAHVWYPLDAGMAVYSLVNGTMIVAVGRYAWLNRAEPGEDE